MGALAKSLEQSEPTTRFPNGQAQIVDVSGTTVGLGTFQPGWRWSNDVRPLVGTDSCLLHHVGYVLSGVLHVETNDGSALDIRSGDVYEIAPGHDAWVSGDEPCILLEWGGRAREFARPAHEMTGGSR
jgi:hypothetical protein